MPILGREKIQIPRNMYALIQHLNNRNKRPISGRANQGSLEATQ